MLQIEVKRATVLLVANPLRALILAWVVVNVLDLAFTLVAGGEGNPILAAIWTTAGTGGFVAFKLGMPIVVVALLYWMSKLRLLIPLTWAIGLVVIWNFAVVMSMR